MSESLNLVFIVLNKTINHIDSRFKFSFVVHLIIPSFCYQKIKK